MPNSDRIVFVTGATGKQGGSVIRPMLAPGWKIRALTRDPGSRAAKTLANDGVEVVAGDLEDPASFEAALLGVYGVYSVQDYWSVGARREAPKELRPQSAMQVLICGDFGMQRPSLHFNRA